MSAFSKIIEQFGEKTLYELLIGDNKACIFKVKDTNNILNEEIDYLYSDMQMFGFVNFKNISEMLENIDRKSEIIEVNGVEKYYNSLVSSITSNSKRLDHLYLPLKNESITVFFEISMLRDFDNKNVLFLLKERLQSDLSYESLFADSYKDKLTGLFNYNSLKLHLDSIHGHRYIGFMDLDDFKSINDTYSHKAGDEVLTKIGCALISIADDNVIFYRKGGDEFAFMSVDLDQNGVKDLIRRLKKAMANIVFKDSKIQFSIGYSEYKDCCGLTGHEVLQAADLAMYESKAEHVGKEVFISIDTAKKIMKESSLEKEIAKFDLKRKR